MKRTLDLHPFLRAAATMGQAVRCLGVLGRAAIVALSREALSFLPYTELINNLAPVAIPNAARTHINHIS